MKRIFQKFLSLLLVAIMAFGATVANSMNPKFNNNESILINKASALTPPYTVSSSYKSGVYYQRLCEVNLTGNQREDITNIAKSQLGYTESASSSSLSGSDTRSYNNYTEYNSWFYKNSSRHEAWCAIFISWCAYQAGISTNIIAKNASASPNGFCSTTKNFNSYIPQKGDIAFINSSHVGLVTDVDSSYIHVVEGNSGSSNGVSSVKVRAIRYKRSNGVSEYGGATIKKFGVPNYILGYTISYDANGGIGAPSGQSGVTSHVISSIVPTRVGYTFVGWTTERDLGSTWGCSYIAGNIITLTQNTTLYAQWSKKQPSSYTLSYNMNGGNGAISSQNGNSTITLSSSVPERFGYSFLGWSTNRSASVADYLPSDTIALSSNITLYAIWKAAESAGRLIGNAYDIYFEYPWETIYFKYVADEYFEDNTKEWSIQFFKFYSDNTSSGENLCIFLYDSNGNELARAMHPKENALLELVYEFTFGKTYYIKVGTTNGAIGEFYLGMSGIINRKLIYNANGGFGAPSTVTGSSYYTVSYVEPIRNDYKFLGWSTNSSAVYPDYIAGQSIAISKDTTLYAVWEKQISNTTCSDCGLTYSASIVECPNCSLEETEAYTLCGNCGKRISRAEIEAHKKECNKETDYNICRMCFHKFYNENDYNNHVSICEGIIPTPSTTTINYGDKIILHADIEGELPVGYSIKWISSNNNFSVAVSDDGKTCTISPESSGETVFTAVIVDENENTVSSDEQTMTAKAGFFQKIIAFFKKLFGLTKTIPQLKK